jgi:uncharacterized repeat protein (TIGR03803 family)
MTKLNWMKKACCVFALCVIGTAASSAQTYTALHAFGAPPDGANPTAGLVQGTDGNFYGTTYGGGANTSYCADTGYNGCGTVFKISPSGTLTVLYSFCTHTNGYCTDGDDPNAGLVLGTDGDFYGTTAYGGTDGEGTVFKITSGGTLTTLHSFCSLSECADGTTPLGGLIQGTNGNFYGTTASGGTNRYEGTVFEITPSGTLTTLHSFEATDGTGPRGGLVQGANGDLYGTTETGGVFYNYGTVFKINPSGTLTTLHSFDYTDGEYPYATLVQGADGDFYGTTFSGGTGCGDDYLCGTVFKITPGGMLTTLHNFDGADGFNLFSGLVAATDGNLYGTTEDGGGYGSIFSITPSGTLTTLYAFCTSGEGGFNCADGQYPYAGLVQGTNGEFYGTTYGGGGDTGECNQGSYGYCGAVFSLNVGLGQFVETLPTSGKVGATVKILGSFLTGATSVTFNGTAATFTVNSKSEITTTVPTGATTGTVQVVTSRLGTLSSNVPFTVRP